MARASGPAARPHLAEPSASDETAIRNYPLLLQRYRRLMEISRDLISTLDLPALLNRIVEAARELTGAEAASLLLIDPQSGDLHLEASTQAGWPTSGDGRAVPMADSVAGSIAREGRPVLIANLAEDPRGLAQTTAWPDFVTRSVLGAPLNGRNRIVGVLEALNKIDAGGFTPDDTDTLVTLAAQAAVAIETARLFQQSDLVSEMIHELRTPLASLAATSYMLLRPELPVERRNEFIRAIQRETARLTTLTNDFLDLSRLESGRARFELEPFSMLDLASECLAMVRPQAEEHGLTCVLAMSPEAAACPPVVGDRAKIKQVLLNLLTNAIKYNRAGGEIRVSGACAGPRFETTVADTGRGIPPESLPRIFDKFYRVADVESRTPGTGLGLAIAKRIVETHGGSITVESSVGVGTTLRFSLPLQT